MQQTKLVSIIGGGPTGLMAAELLAHAGHKITVYDHMPSIGRKFLMAGRGGLNLTHSEPLESFIQRYGTAGEWLEPSVRNFTPDALRSWCEGLGQETFVGSSGRLFPRSMKTAPLLRAWLTRLNELGVNFALRHQWQGWDGDALRFSKGDGQKLIVKPDATLLALGGASWPRLGSDGAWTSLLENSGIALSPLRPANCGFTVPWSTYFSARFAGTPLKPVALTHSGITRQGEAMITLQGIEGSAVYALSAAIRASIEQQGEAQLLLDLRPGMPVDAVAQKLDMRRGRQSLGSHLRKAGFSPLAVSLLHEIIPKDKLAQACPAFLAGRLKALPIALTGTTGLTRAISTAGGIMQSAVNENLMLCAKAGVFVAGEMLDWEAPTGGYLLQGCFSTAVTAAQGMLHYLALSG